MNNAAVMHQWFLDAAPLGLVLRPVGGVGHSLY